MKSNRVLLVDDSDDVRDIYQEGIRKLFRSD